MPWSLEPKWQNSDLCKQDSTLNNQGERKYKALTQVHVKRQLLVLGVCALYVSVRYSEHLEHFCHSPHSFYRNHWCTAMVLFLTNPRMCVIN